MAYDIYGNILRQGYCKVHPEVPESYPCYRCTQYEELQQHPTVMDYLRFDKEKFEGITKSIIAADEQNNEAAFLTAVENLICLLQMDFVSSVLHKMIEKEKANENGQCKA